GRWQVRPRLAADETGFGIQLIREVGRDARPVDVQAGAGAVVDVLQVPPGRRAVLAAAAADAEIRIGTVRDDESAAGQEVAVGICGAAWKREGERRDPGRKTCPNCTHD